MAAIETILTNISLQEAVTDPLIVSMLQEHNEPFQLEEHGEDVLNSTMTFSTNYSDYFVIKRVPYYENYSQETALKREQKNG
ncbi:hypothetical protein CAEBREN_24605 [Caenorhabditis brenneri]|uniref:Uncharacterized protein n=1 Tax=Caenorhabditis brenneri TaxID=135651 RepID=G0NPV6_CAEBE|nr:hypothetical protein CAEBREN_24605 [Caenorhabditis brenneri]